MDLSSIRITGRQALIAAGVLLSASGGYYSLQAQVTRNADQVRIVEARSKADSNRIRDIGKKAAAAEKERELIREQVKENGRKLDAILRELRR